MTSVNHDNGSRIAIVEWRAFVRNSLRGFLTLRLRCGLVLHDCPVHQSHGRRWVGLPAKPMLTRDGQPLRDAAGKPRYSPIASWPDRATQDRFSAAAIEALLRAHPDAFDMEGGGDV